LGAAAFSELVCIAGSSCDFVFFREAIIEKMADNLFVDVSATPTIAIYVKLCFVNKL
jgi:hypothetical protein